MNPVTAEQEIKNKVIQYLDRNMPIKKSMPENLRKAFEDFQFGSGEGSMDFVRSPYIEVAQSYKSVSHSLQDMVHDGLLCEEVAEAFAKYFDCDRKNFKPYVHQYNSVKAAGWNSKSDKQNLVVCTGTESGKTECFLLPMIDAIYRQHKKADHSQVLTGKIPFRLTLVSAEPKELFHNKLLMYIVANYYSRNIQFVYTCRKMIV
jgi:ATP-dependent helicase YprA (DUF1998 family)